MNTTENNKLIAEFMRINLITIDDIRANKNPYISSADGYTKEDLQYHTSWDWLMPVIERCLVGEAEQSEEISKQLDKNKDRIKKQAFIYSAFSTTIKNIYEGICNQDISFTYNAVVEFINQLNK